MRLSPATKTENQSSWENQSSYPEPFRGTTGLGNKIITLLILYLLVYYVIFFGLFVYFLFFMRAILCQHTVDSNTVMHGTSNLHCWCHIWLLEPAQGAMMAVHWQKHPLSWYKECKMHIFKTDNSANEIDMKRFMRSWTFPCAFTARRYASNFISFFNLTFKSDYLL